MATLLPVESAVRVSSGTEFFARAIDPNNWSQVNLLMMSGLMACFDAGGKTPSIAPKAGRRKRKVADDSPVMAVVGLASQAGVWAEFDTRWSEILYRYDVPFFHAADFAHSNWPFDEGWKGEENKRRDFQGELMQVIQDCGLRKFGSVLWVADQNKAKGVAGLDNDATATPYVMCARAAVQDFIAYSIGEGQRHNIEYIFEKGDEEDTLRRHFQKHGFHDPSFRWSKPVEKKGVTQNPFIGLQAAGWIVWEYYVSFRRLVDELFKHDTDGRWGLNQFEEATRGSVKILYKSNPLSGYSKQLSERTQDGIKAVSRSLQRLETAKREGAKD